MSLEVLFSTQGSDNTPQWEDCFLEGEEAERYAKDWAEFQTGEGEAGGDYTGRVNGEVRKVHLNFYVRDK